MRKWGYFEEWMTSDQLKEAKRIVQELWTTKYAAIPVVASVVVKSKGGSSLSEPQIVCINKL